MHQSDRKGLAGPESSLRRRLLELLAKEPLSPTALAEETGARKESVSRLLKELRAEELVEARHVEGDRRRRAYALTAAGEVALSRMRAYESPGPRPAEPSQAKAVRFLYSALAASTRERRQRNALKEALARQEKVLAEARKIGDGELVIESLHELGTTLRQDRREAEAEALLGELDEIALERSGYSGNGLSLQAAAHRFYALGRLGEKQGEELERREKDLIAAARNYRELAEGATGAVAEKWRARQGWGTISLAANYRTRSRFESALITAAEALKIFEEIEEPYGESHCLFRVGFCLRLLGDFDGAGKWLENAHGLAETNKFERFEADSLMQLGEVYRCRGELDKAWDALEESRERSVKMGVSTTQAFAHSALGAVAFQQRRWRESLLELRRAQERFEGTGHLEGLALNERRLAAASRLLSEDGNGTEEAKRQLMAAERLSVIAQDRYHRMRRPAGVVACEIEQDRLLMCRDEAPAHIEELINLIDDEDKRPERECLELDPWVPRVLNDFAKETGDSRLIDRSRQLLTDAQKRLSDRVQQVIGIFDAGDWRSTRGWQPELLADQMGGEPPQHLEENVALTLV